MLQSVITFSLLLMKKILLFSLFISLLFSCKTDFDINAKWKDTTVVYGLLSQNDTNNIHYIKINKAFLGNGNALVMAQNPDSSSYGNNLDVRVDEFTNGNQTNSWTLTDTIVNKYSGTFPSPTQHVYKFKAALNEYAVYNLTIRNKITGKIITSSTPLVQDISIETPMPAPSTANFHAVSPIPIEWFSAVNGKLYQVTIRFNYWEKDLDHNDSIKRHVDWIIGSCTSQTTLGNEDMNSISYNGSSFFQYLGNKIPSMLGVPSHVSRRMAVPNVDFIFSVAANEFNTYLEVSSVSTGISQQPPQYTDITNGIGIFSSRSNTVLPLAMQHPESVDSLFNGQYTKNLNFH